jgi:hypothetical protein
LKAKRRFRSLKIKQWNCPDWEDSRLSHFFT